MSPLMQTRQGTHRLCDRVRNRRLLGPASQRNPLLPLLLCESSSSELTTSGCRMAT